MSNLTSPQDNKLLSALAQSQFSLLAPNLIIKDLPQGQVLLEAGEEFERVYFPLNGMLSLLVVMRDGKAIETATVGREGVVGAMAGLGLYKSSVRVVVQLALTVAEMSAAQFRKAVDKSEAIRNLCLEYNEDLLFHARVTAACNALHPVEARFSRWLLQTADRAASETIQLTQEFLSEMLGVQRTSISEVAGHLQRLGMIEYSRGVITIIDRKALVKCSCECYETLREH